MSRVRILIAAGCLAALFACNTPSVPLPPPLLSAITPIAGPMAGLIEIQGSAQMRLAGARVYVYNRSRGDGVIAGAGADGSFSTSPFAAGDGDLLDVSYDTPQGERSGSACATLTGLVLSSLSCP